MSGPFDWEQEDRAVAQVFAERERRVKSPKSRGEGYHYTYFGGLHPSCSCEDQVYRKARVGDWCKHLREWTDTLEAAEAGIEEAKSRLAQRTTRVYLGHKPGWAPWDVAARCEQCGQWLGTESPGCSRPELHLTREQAESQ